MGIVECSFCDVDGFRTNSTVVLEDDLCLFANAENTEVLRGSGVIVPKRHAETVFDLTTAEIASTFALLCEARTLLDRRYRPDGYNIGWNCYGAAGQVVHHAHLHVLLRFKDEPRAGKGLRWFLRQDDNVRPDPSAFGVGARDFRE
ncbi:MAG: HIT family protein [Acidimicrobiia bacterium]